MATSQVREVLQRLRRAVLLRDGAGLTDGQLLEDYLSRRHEAALAASADGQAVQPLRRRELRCSLVPAAVNLLRCPRRAEGDRVVQRIEA